MVLFRRLLALYRRIQYLFCGRLSNGTMPQGVQCAVEQYESDINHGDIVHPCVRYIPEGYEGHKWWMVYTPYYKANAAIENPILCYGGEGINDDVPPSVWKVYCKVNEKPADGYNSDPTLLFHEGQLYVYWRENIVQNKSKYNYWRATFVAKVVRGGVEKCSSIPILVSEDDEIDAETCPTFLQENDGGITAYAMHLQFHSKWVKKLRRGTKKVVERFLLITDLLGIYSQQKHFGIAIWKGVAPDEPFTYLKTVKFYNCNILYRPWHMDLFDYGGKRFIVLQTNMSNADLCLAYSSDGELFTLYKHPLITNKSIGKVGIYKPCAGVTSKGVFYLYYTAQDVDNRALNKLYLTTMPFGDLLEKIR